MFVYSIELGGKILNVVCDCVCVWSFKCCNIFAVVFYNYFAIVWKCPFCTILIIINHLNVTEKYETNERNYRIIMVCDEVMHIAPTTAALLGTCYKMLLFNDMSITNIACQAGSKQN